MKIPSLSWTNENVKCTTDMKPPKLIHSIIRSISLISVMSWLLDFWLRREDNISILRTEERPYYLGHIPTDRLLAIIASWPGEPLKKILHSRHKWSFLPNDPLLPYDKPHIFYNLAYLNKLLFNCRISPPPTGPPWPTIFLYVHDVQIAFPKSEVVLLLDNFHVFLTFCVSRED